MPLLLGIICRKEGPMRALHTMIPCGCSDVVSFFSFFYERVENKMIKCGKKMKKKKKYGSLGRSLLRTENARLIMH